MYKQKYYGDPHGPENQKFAVLITDGKVRGKFNNPSTHETDSVIRSVYVVEIAEGHEWSRSTGPNIIWKENSQLGHENLQKVILKAEQVIKDLQEKNARKPDQSLNEMLDEMGFK